MCMPTSSPFENVIDSTTTRSCCRKRSAPSEASSKQQGRRVSFFPSVSVITHISRTRFSEEELRTCWYSKAEYDRIRRSCIKQITMMDQEECRLNEIKHCSRGLESHTRKTAKIKSINHSDALTAVLDEQDRQLFDCPDQSNYRFFQLDNDAIRIVYHRVTSSSQLWAHQVGLQDQRDAELIWD